MYTTICCMLSMGAHVFVYTFIYFFALKHTYSHTYNFISIKVWAFACICVHPFAWSMHFLCVCVSVCDRQRTIPYTFLAVWHVFGYCSAHACDDRCKPVCIWNEINCIVTIHHFDHFFLSVACVLDKTHNTHTHTLKAPMPKLH